MFQKFFLKMRKFTLKTKKNCLTLKLDSGGNSLKLLVNLVILSTNLFDCLGALYLKSKPLCSNQFDSIKFIV